MVAENVPVSPVNTRLQSAIECVLFVAGEPVGLSALAKATETDAETVRQALQSLSSRYSNTGLQLMEIANGYQLATRSEYAPIVARFAAPNAHRLSRPALETVTIIAYRQPCTQADVEAIRGVASGGVLKTLETRELIREAGRKVAPGRPILYETTATFLHYFGLASLTDLPPLEADADEHTGETPQQVAQRQAEAFAAAGVTLQIHP